MYGRQAFAIAGPYTRNSLPDPVRNPNSTKAAFRRLLKTFVRTVLAHLAHQEVCWRRAIQIDTLTLNVTSSSTKVLTCWNWTPRTRRAGCYQVAGPSVGRIAADVHTHGSNSCRWASRWRTRKSETWSPSRYAWFGGRTPRTRAAITNHSKKKTSKRIKTFCRGGFQKNRWAQLCAELS